MKKLELIRLWEEAAKVGNPTFRKPLLEKFLCALKEHIEKTLNDPRARELAYIGSLRGSQRAFPVLYVREFSPDKKETLFRTEGVVLHLQVKNDKGNLSIEEFDASSKKLFMEGKGDFFSGSDFEEFGIKVEEGEKSTNQLIALAILLEILYPKKGPSGGAPSRTGKGWDY